jgi:hypothetical protein
MALTNAVAPANAVRVVAALAIVLALAVAPAHAQFGIAGGLNFESTDDIRGSVQGGVSGTQEAAFDNSTGYHIGLVYDLGLGPVSVRPGVFFRRVGDVVLPSGPEEVVERSLNTIEVPVDLRLTVLPLPVVKPYLLAGPMASFPIGEDELDDLTEDVSVSANVGLGATISLPGLTFSLQPELRYEFGLTSYIGDESAEVGGVTFNPEDEPNFSAFSVRLNVLF